MRYCPTCGSRYEDGAAYCPQDGVATRPLENAPAPGVDPLIGQVIDSRYRVEKQIGEGGMGVVYLATHTVLGKKLALKVLRGEMARDQEVVQRFMQEAQAATSIGHENIVNISDFGRLPDGAVFFVMEYLDGESLSHVIARGGSIPTRDALSIIRQIASALNAAHARGIVHRDMKPDNIFVMRRPGEGLVVKVLDFGIAKVGGAASKLTRTGVIFGTPHYMSPEQAAGQSVDHRTDIYALGVIMYEMFTGRVPFDADTFMAILSKHMFEAPIPPSQLAENARSLGAIEDLILKALAKKPEQRYQAMAELVADVDSVAMGGQIEIGRTLGADGAQPGSLADALEPPSRTEMRLNSLMPPPELPRDRGPLIAAVAIGGLLVVGGVAMVIGLSGGDEVAASARPRPVVPSVVLNPAPPAGTAPAISAVAPSPGTAAVALVQPLATPPLPTVHIESDPAGAQVTLAGALVGVTPLDLPRPANRGAQVLELTLAGYERATVTVEDQSAPRLRVPMHHVSRRARAEPPVRTTGVATPWSSTRSASPTKQGSSEILNPFD